MMGSPFYVTKVVPAGVFVRFHAASMTTWLMTSANSA
jgi:hypothetical protein